MSIYTFEIDLNGIKTNWTIYLASLGMAVLFDSIFGITLMVLFIKRLRSMMNRMSYNHDNNDKVINHLKSMGSIVTKLTLLTSIAVVSTEMSVIIFFATTGGWFVIYFDILINSFCLLFSYKMYHGAYQKCCCLCILCCKKSK